MANFRSPTNEKDEINNGWLQELLSLAPRVSRASTCPFVAPTKQAIYKRITTLINLLCKLYK